MTAPLIQLRPFQEEAFWAPYRLFLDLCRRQVGKTYGAAAKAIDINMEKPWNDVIYTSASINVGSEMVQKDVQVWNKALEKLRQVTTGAGMMLESSFDGLDYDACCDLFEHNKLRVTIYHTRSEWSRTIVIAPNPATARGWTGTVMLDEIEFIPDFDAIFEAVEPIMSSDPTFRMRMATTYGKNDNSWVFRNCIPPDEFDISVVNPRGKWYTSTSGIKVHRFDAWDAYAAGLMMYDLNDGHALTVDEHRAASLDRDGWDRNYGLIAKRGGLAALPRHHILSANQLCRSLFPCVAVEDIKPDEIERHLPRFTDTAPVIGISVDLATTTNKKSNPSAIAIGERVGRYTVPRLSGRFHSADPELTERIVLAAIAACPARPQFVIIDATNERFFAIALQRKIRALGIGCYLYIASETLEVTAGQKVTKKTYAGNLLQNALEDGVVPIPAAKWLEDDLRSVRKEKGLFENVIDNAGNHGDVFDALKMLVFGFARGCGPVEVDAADVGGGGFAPDDDLPPEVAAEVRQAVKRRFS
jgi:hypothetical protein